MDIKDVTGNKELKEAVAKYARSSDKEFTIKELDKVLKDVQALETETATAQLLKDADINFLMLLIDNYSKLGPSFGAAYIERIIARLNG